MNMLKQEKKWILALAIAVTVGIVFYAFFDQIVTWISITAQ